MSARKFMPGLLIAQGVASALSLHAIASPSPATAWLIGGVVSITTLTVALWFRAIAGHLVKDAMAELKDGFAQERERLLLAAEAEKRSILEESHQRALHATNRAHGRAGFKLGAAFVGMLALALTLLYVQLITVGLVLLSAAGGGLAGYVIRIRQENRAARPKATHPPLPASAPALEMIPADPDTRQFPAPKRRRNLP